MLLKLREAAENANIVNFLKYENIVICQYDHSQRSINKEGRACTSAVWTKVSYYPVWSQISSSFCFQHVAINVELYWKQKMNKSSCMQGQIARLWMSLVCLCASSWSETLEAPRLLITLIHVCSPCTSNCLLVDVALNQWNWLFCYESEKSKITHHPMEHLNVCLPSS